MKQYNQHEIDTAMTEISEMSHERMCDLWRNSPVGSIYFRSDLPTAGAFKERLFTHFGGITPEISRSIGW